MYLCNEDLPFNFSSGSIGRMQWLRSSKEKNPMAGQSQLVLYKVTAGQTALKNTRRSASFFPQRRTLCKENAPATLSSRDRKLFVAVLL